MNPTLLITGGHAALARQIRAGGGNPLAALVPMQRAGTTLEGAQSVVWLLSQESSKSTGALLDVTGGR